jgi:hypothetical protein
VQQAVQQYFVQVYERGEDALGQSGAWEGRSEVLEQGDQKGTRLLYNMLLYLMQLWDIAASLFERPAPHMQHLSSHQGPISQTPTNLKVTRTELE